MARPHADPETLHARSERSLVTFERKSPLYEWLFLLTLHECECDEGEEQPVEPVGGPEGCLDGRIEGPEGL